MNFKDDEYHYTDAALAALFVAGKAEDTYKKGREILAAAHNVKHPERHLHADDKVS
jgi:CTD kinase subunit beta